MSPHLPDTDIIIANTQHWLTQAVIGLQLCPFAKAVHLKKQIRYAVSQAQTPEQLVDDLVRELGDLVQADPSALETTLLIHPHALQDFMAFNDFLDIADAVLVELGLEGDIQIASFHPDYQFEGSSPDDIDNYTNRSPYPTLHLLREASIEQAMKNFDGADRIVQRNIDTLRQMGQEGWRRWWAAASTDGCLG